VRYTEPRDLAPVFHLAEQTPAPRQARLDFLRGYQAPDVSSWVAAVGDEVVGFVACRFVLPRRRAAARGAGRAAAREGAGRGGGHTQGHAETGSCAESSATRAGARRSRSC